jgi:chromosome segregation ATPase
MFPKTSQEWQFVFAIISALSPLLFGGVIYYLMKYFVRLTQYTKDREDATKQLEKDMNGLGERISKIEKGCTENATALNKLEQSVGRNDTRITELFKDMGKLESTLEKLETMGTQNKIDIIAAFQEKASVISKNVSSLEVQVARLDERLQIVKDVLKP